MRIPLFFDYLPDGSIRHTDDVDATIQLLLTDTAQRIDSRSFFHLRCNCADTCRIIIDILIAVLYHHSVSSIEDRMQV